MTRSLLQCLPGLWLRLAWVFAAVVAVSTSPSGAGPAHARSFQDILDSGELRVCFAPIHPSVVLAEPEGCRKDCTFSGPAFEAAQAFADSLGDAVTLRALRIDWDEQFFNDQGRTDRDAEYVPALLDFGHCDLYPNNLTKNAWRLQKMDIVTMFTNRMMVLVNAESQSKIRGPAELAGRVAVVEKNTSYHSWLQEENRTTFAAEPVDIRLQPTTEGLYNLAQGRADFTVIDADAAFWIIRHQFPELIMAFPVGAMEEVGWGIRKDHPELHHVIQNFFDHQRAGRDSPLNAIWNHHFGMNLNQFISLLGSMQE